MNQIEVQSNVHRDNPRVCFLLPQPCPKWCWAQALPAGEWLPDDKSGRSRALSTEGPLTINLQETSAWVIHLSPFPFPFLFKVLSYFWGEWTIPLFLSYIFSEVLRPVRNIVVDMPPSVEEQQCRDREKNGAPGSRRASVWRLCSFLCRGQGLTLSETCLFHL